LLDKLFGQEKKEASKEPETIASLKDNNDKEQLEFSSLHVATYSTYLRSEIYALFAMTEHYV